MKLGGKKERIDKLLMERGIVQGRERAKALIMMGRVSVECQTIDKPGTKVGIEAKIQLEGEDQPYVSRGGVKLEGALNAFGVDPRGMAVMDVGASTGGKKSLRRGCRIWTVGMETTKRPKSDQLGEEEYSVS